MHVLLQNTLIHRIHAFEAASRISPRGRAKTYPIAFVLDRIFFVCKTGCQWNQLPTEQCEMVEEFFRSIHGQQDTRMPSFVRASRRSTWAMGELPLMLCPYATFSVTASRLQRRAMAGPDLISAGDRLLWVARARHRPRGPQLTNPRAHSCHTGKEAGRAIHSRSRCRKRLCSTLRTRPHRHPYDPHMAG